MKIEIKLIIILISFIFPISAVAHEEHTGTLADLKVHDSDGDGLSDFEEIYIYHSEIQAHDSDGDGYFDGEEVKFSYDPNLNGNDKLEKRIVVTTADQSLSYMLGDYIVDSFKISSGKKYTPTPLGEFKVLKKRPTVDYGGVGFSYPDTKWNLMFKPNAAGNFYIHGAYWHNKFGTPVSHGCVNVAYEDMESLYNWADLGTKVVVK